MYKNVIKIWWIGGALWVKAENDWQDGLLQVAMQR